MATEVPVDDYPARDRHQIQTFVLAAVILSAPAPRLAPGSS